MCKYNGKVIVPLGSAPGVFQFDPNAGPSGMSTLLVDSTSGSTPLIGVNGAVQSTAVYNNKLFVAGQFSQWAYCSNSVAAAVVANAGCVGTSAAINGLPAVGPMNVASWDGTTWGVLPLDNSGYVANNGIAGSISIALVAFQSKLFFIGTFARFGYATFPNGDPASPDGGDCPTDGTGTSTQKAFCKAISAPGIAVYDASTGLLAPFTGTVVGSGASFTGYDVYMPTGTGPKMAVVYNNELWVSSNQRSGRLCGKFSYYISSGSGETFCDVTGYAYGISRISASGAVSSHFPAATYNGVNYAAGLLAFRRAGGAALKYATTMRVTDGLLRFGFGDGGFTRLSRYTAYANYAPSLTSFNAGSTTHDNYATLGTTDANLPGLDQIDIANGYLTFDGTTVRSTQLGPGCSAGVYVCDAAAESELQYVTLSAYVKATYNMCTASTPGGNTGYICKTGEGFAANPPVSGSANNGNVLDIASANGRVYVAGNFYSIAVNYGSPAAPSTSTNVGNIASIDSSGAVSPVFQRPSNGFSRNGVSGAVYGLFADGSRVYMIGLFRALAENTSPYSSWPQLTSSVFAGAGMLASGFAYFDGP